MGSQRTGRTRSRSTRSAVGTTSGDDPATAQVSAKPQLDLFSPEPVQTVVAPEPVQALSFALGELVVDANNRAAADKIEVVEDFNLAGENIGTGGLGQKYRDNIAAIRILKAMDGEGRKATPDERKAIARYVGWGALKGVFDPENRQWAKEHEELKGLLTDAEWTAARASMLNAHYTSPTVVSAIYGALEHMGFQSGRVLEPSVGVGNFFGLMPAEMRKPSQLHGVELDPLTAKIAAALYPSAKIKNSGFQDFNVPAGYFDLVVGNPPFGSEPIVDMERSAYSGMSIHNYFLAKSIDKLRPGGMMAVVVSRYFLDAVNDSVRKWIGERADLVSAVRLPYTAFKENAGTEVVTDILLFRKHDEQRPTQEKLAELEEMYGNDSLERLREIQEFTEEDFAEPGNEVAKEEAMEQLRAYIAYRERSEGRDWIRVGTLEMVDEKAGKDLQHRINNYFLNHPENVLGTHAATSTMYRANDYNVEPSGDLTAQLDEWVGRLPKAIYQSIERTTEQEIADVAIPDGVKPGSYFVAEDGAIMIRGHDHLGMRTAAPWEAPNTRAIERMKGMIALRDGLRAQMRIELSDAPDAEIEAGRAALNHQYDAFHKSFGFVHDATNLRLFVDDTEASLLLALEFDYDKGVSKAVAERDGIEPKPPSAHKADILLQRVLFPPRDDIKVESAKDALLASLNYKGCLDLAYMESVYPGHDAEAIVDELGDVVFDDPIGGLMVADEYLSGDVKTKLEEARAAAIENPTYKRNVLALEKVIPADKRPSEINATLGAMFIPAEVFADFGEHVTGIRPHLSYVKTTGQWSITFPSSGHPDPLLNITKWGTLDMPAMKIFQSTLEGRGVVVAKAARQSDGSTRMEVQHNETEAAREKQQAMKDEWKRWVWSDAERADKLAALFNEKFNRTVPRKYNGAHLSLPGLSPARELLPHQKNAVWRTLQSRQILLDHVVGAGKTAVIVAATMEMRRLGIARKPLIAVPNHLTLQWQSEFFKFFPAARVLAATPDDFSKENREKFFAKIVTGDWDAVIVGHSSLKKIGLPIETENNVLSKQVKELSVDIELMKRERGDRHIVRDMERIKARLEAQMKTKQQKIGERDKTLTFDELGIDAFAIDEIHEFKNLFYNSTMDKVPGMGNPSGSDKAFDLFVKTQWMYETFDDKAVIIGATGTPISNSMVEMFNLQRYMQYPSLEKDGLHVFDAWARQFANANSVYEVSASGTGYRQSSRLEFAGLNALMPLYQSFTDTVTLDQLKAQERARGKVFPAPKIKGGQPINIVAPRSPQVAAFMGVPQLELDNSKPVFGFNPAGETVRIEQTKEGRWKAVAETPVPGSAQTYNRHLATAETEKEVRLHVVQSALTPAIMVDPNSILGQFNNLRHLVRETEGRINALSLTSQANKAGLDYRLIDPAVPDFPGSKVNSAVDRMLELYHHWNADKGTQLVFCDLSAPLSSRQKMASQEMRVYVRDLDSGALQHKRGTLHTLEGREELPFYIVKEKSLFSVYDAVSGAFITGAGSKDAARDEARRHLNDDELRSEWYARRERLGEIRQDDIEDYNAAHNHDENAEGAAVSMTDIAGVSGAQGFSVYDDIKQKLIARGVPDNEIAFVHDYATPAAKDKLFRAVNQGDVRFLLGSTPKMGAGTNVQKRLVGLHHIDAPWRPSDLEQREGRIVRQGNRLYERDPEGFEVAIYRYATEQTYDTRRWQILEHKVRMIGQVRAWDGSLNSIDDIGSEAANAADMKAAASGDPLILEETKLRNEVRRLESLQAAHHDEVAALAREAARKEHQANVVNPALLDEYMAMQRQAEQHPVVKDVFPGVVVGGRLITDRNQAVDAINSKIMSVYTNSSVETFTYRGVEFTLNGEGRANSPVMLEAPTTALESYLRGVDARLPSPSGFLTRFANFVAKIPERVDQLKDDIKRDTRDATALRIASRKPFDKASELEAVRDAHKRVQRQLVTKGPEIPAEQRPLLEAAMRHQRELLQQKGFGDALREFLGQAQASANEVTSAPQNYQDLLSRYIADKRSQAARIGARLLETMQAQQAKVDIGSDGPRWWATPSSKQAWQESQARLDARRRTLSARLESVRGIESDRGLYRPKIEELATRKLRREHPALAAVWDAAREQERRERFASAHARQEKPSRAVGARV